MNPDEKSWAFILIVCAVCFLVVQEVFKTRPYIPFAALCIAAVAYYGYRHVSERNTKYEKKQQRLDQIDQDDMPVGNSLVKTNTALVNNIVGFSKYAYIDNAAFKETINHVYAFYDLYAKVLMGKLDPRLNMYKLMALRKAIVNTMYTFYTKRYWLHSDGRFNEIVNSVTRITRLPIKVIKNKYDLNDMVNNPLPYNMYLEHELF